MKKQEDPDRAEQLAMDGFDPEPVIINDEPVPKESEPTVEQWATLFEVADTIKLIAPWRFLWDADIITIMLPGRDEPVFCSVLGRNEECYGIVAYPGYDAFTGYRRLASSAQGVPMISAGMDQRCLVCNYGDREEVTPKDREVYKALGRKFRGRNEWIYFRAMDPGYAPWYLHPDQVDLMIQVLQNFAMACTHLLSGPLRVQFDEGQTLLRHYSAEREMWLNEAIDMPPIPIYMRPVIIDDDLLIARLKKQKRTSQRLELDIVYLPMPIQEHKDVRPHMPRMAVLMDRKSSLALDQYIGDQEEDTVRGVIDMLVSHIETQGKPAAIYVRDERMLGYIDDLCKRTGVKLIHGEGVHVIDAFLREMMDFLN